MNSEKYLEEFNLSIEQLEKFNIYKDLLIEANQKMNLTTITNIDEIYIKHFYDSLLLYKINPQIDNLYDIGTGAGFPGMPYAIVSNQKVVLVEATKKRCDFLKEVKDKLLLKNVTITNDRIENIKEKYSYATARAVAKINILLELITPNLEVGGIFYALKGSNYNDELNEAQHALKELNVRVNNIYKFSLPNNLGERIIIEFKKISETPSKYPRRYANIVSKPL